MHTLSLTTESHPHVSDQASHIYDITESLAVKTIQKRSLSCEISAAADILSHYEWTVINEDSLLEILPKSWYNTLPKKDTNWKLQWWNPEEGFVWYIDLLPDWQIARQRKMTWYWVLERPIEKIFNTYGYSTLVLNENQHSDSFTPEKHLTYILKELRKWNLSEVWWDICTDPKYYSGKEHKCFYDWEPNWNKDRTVSWYYKNRKWEDTLYNGLIWEHIFYILWYEGTVQNPENIILWDTYTWKHTYPLSEFMRKWKLMQYRTITIFKDSKQQ